MTGIKLSGAEIGCMATFEKLTKAAPKDCIIDGERGVIFVVNSKDMGQAIGRKGSNLKNASRILKKNVGIVEYSHDPLIFIKNLLYPIKPKNINIEGRDSKTVAKISVERKDRALAIGSKGKNINRIKKIVTRHHDIDDVVIL